MSRPQNPAAGSKTETCVVPLVWIAHDGKLIFSRTYAKLSDSDRERFDQAMREVC